MLRNPEIRRMLTISVPLCAVFTAVCFWLDVRAGLLTAALSILLLTLYLLSARQRYRTMAHLAEDIDAVLHGRQDISFAQYTEGEISLLRSELRKMTVRLTEQADQLRQEKVQLAESMADISHQMRTPLTAVNLLLAGLGDPDATEETRQSSLRALRRQVQRMDWLVNALLKLAKLDAGTVQFRRERVALSELIARAAEPLSILMEVKGQQLSVQASGSADCDLAWTAEALGNILKNCTEHMHEGTITVTAEENAVAACIRIRDEGGGIDPEDLPHLFERYYKGRNASQESVGIGLALSRSIAAAQNGTLTAANVNGGAEFTLKLYKGTV
ncbi:MAG: sensor histidine kinase [Faecousia sp.]